MKTKTIRQTITLDASPHDVYEMLMDEKKHARFIGGTAGIRRYVRGRLLSTAGIQPIPTRSLFRTQRLSIPGGWAIGRMIIIPR